MHCRQPVEAYAFAQQVLHLPLNVRTVMYVEGGGQAGLLVRSAALTRELVGLSPSGLLVTGDLRAVLPNVLGARRKGVPAQPDESPAQGQEQGTPVAAPANVVVSPAATADETDPNTGAAQNQPQKQEQAAPPAAPLPLAPSHTLLPAHVPATSASDTAAAPLTEPGTPLAQPPARGAKPAVQQPDQSLKK